MRKTGLIWLFGIALLAHGRPALASEGDTPPAFTLPFETSVPLGKPARATTLRIEQRDTSLVLRVGRSEAELPLSVASGVVVEQVALASGTRVAVVRGAGNPIPIDPDEAGGPGGNVAGLGLASDGRTLVVSGFGDLFAFPVAKPGRLLALSLPSDLVDGEAISGAFVPGTTAVATTPGRTLGGLVVGAFHEDGPEVFVAVSGTLSPTTFLGTGPASLGTLRTFGRIR